MKVKAPPRMSSIQWFVSIAAGLAMFLLPQDAQSYFSDVYRQIFVAVIAFGIALVLLLLFKLYEPIGVADVDDVICSMAGFGLGGFVKYLLDRIRRSVTKGKEAKICYVWESQRRERRKGKTADQAQEPAKE